MKFAVSSPRPGRDGLREAAQKVRDEFKAEIDSLRREHGQALLRLFGGGEPPPPDAGLLGPPSDDDAAAVRELAAQLIAEVRGVGGPPDGGGGRRLVATAVLDGGQRRRRLSPIAEGGADEEKGADEEGESDDDASPAAFRRRCYGRMREASSLDGGGLEAREPPAQAFRRRYYERRGMTPGSVAGRLADGRCTTCGVKLYEIVRESDALTLGKLRHREHRTRCIPVNDPGRVRWGVCLACEVGPGASAAGKADQSAGAEKNGSLPINSKPYFNGEYRGELDGLGRRSGRGVFCWTTGDTYDGEWKADQPDGYGIFRWANGDLYRGSFSRGMKQGWGTYRFTTADELWCGDEYEGQFWRDMMHGLGTYKCANGDVYKGEFRHDRMEGEGTFRRFSDGEVYEGQFRGGTMLVWEDEAVLPFANDFQ